MAKVKRVKNVWELAKPMGLGKKFRKEVKKRIKNSTISFELSFLRTKNNLTQKEMAKKISSNTSFVEKFENTLNGDMRLKDIQKYLNAFSGNENISIRITKNKITVKEHYVEDKDHDKKM